METNKTSMTEVQCVVFERAREIGDRERYVDKMKQVEA